jgi:hypothetical protein
MVYLLQMVIFHGYVSHNQRLLALSTVVFRLFQRILPVGIWCPFDLGKTSMSPSNMPEIGVYKHFAHPVCAHSLLKTFEAGKSACMPAFAARTHTHMFASLLHERDTPFPHFPRWTIWAVWNWSHHVLMPDFPHFHHLQTPWDCGVNHSTLQSSKRIR